MQPYKLKHNLYNRRSKVDFTIFFRLLSEAASQPDSSDALMVLEPSFYEPVYNTQVLLSPFYSILWYDDLSGALSSLHNVHPPVFFWFFTQTNRVWLLHAFFIFVCLKMSAFNLFGYDCMQRHGMVFGDDDDVCVCVAWPDSTLPAVEIYYVIGRGGEGREWKRGEGEGE